MANIIRTESWAKLLKEARNMGLEPSDVKAFLQAKQQGAGQNRKRKCL